MNIFDKIKPILFEAGQEILGIYESNNFGTVIKNDNSPVTNADRISNEIILRGIKSFSNNLIISEEIVNSEIRISENENFWLVDPLDGTKDFLAKNDEFAIVISLIKNSEPVFGVIYLPILNIYYWAEKGLGSFKNYNRIYNNSKRQGNDIIGTVSRFHETKEDICFFEKNNITNITKFGGAIKFCRMAEGEVDIYPRFVGSSEWDTAAGQLLVSEAGCRVIDMVTNNDMLYNKVDFRNNNFIAIRNGLPINN